ncbi:hypothetical protein TNCV_1362431 [Trichonephila clavipes]|nr:hypothetical protein TNCV_1362431 [Trichonephila clavipes]
MTSNLQDNVHLHVSYETKATKKIRWEMLDHLPYSPDLSPCDFYTFRLLRPELCFCLDDEVKEARQGLSQESTTLFLERRHRLTGMEPPKRFVFQ